MANSSSTTLTFFDRSTATNGLDLLLDNVRVTGGSPPPPPVNTAPVASADNYSTLTGTPLSVPAPGVLGNDTDAQSNPLTASLVTNVSNGSLSFNSNGSFSYQPAAGFEGTDSFTYKANDGSLDSGIATVSIVVAAEALGSLVNGSFEDGYNSWTVNGSQAIRTHSSFLPPDGQSVVVFNGNNETPNGVLAQTFSTTPGVTYGVAFNVGLLSFSTSQQKIEVRATGSGTLLSQIITRSGSNNGVPVWSSHSYNFVANSSSTTLTFFDRSTATNGLDLLLDNVRVTGGSAPPPPVNTAPVAGNDSYSTLTGTPLSVPAPGVLGNDTDAQSNPLTASLVTNVSHGSLSLNSNGSFVYNPAAGFVGTDSFTYKANDGSLDSGIATVSITVRAAALAGLVNGSFESDLADWTVSGAVDVKSAVPYVASNGNKLLAFNSANQAPNGLLSQTFATTAGETYQLQFDLGVLSYNTQYQKMGVSVTGSSALFSREITIRGAGGGSNRWFPQSFTFVANSGSTTLTFQDRSATTSNLDLLLDHVRVTPSSAAAATATNSVVDLPDPVPPVSLSMSGTPGDMDFVMPAAEPGTYFLERSPDLKNWTRVSGSEQTVAEPAMLSFKDPQPKSEEDTQMFYRVGFVEAGEN